MDISKDLYKKIYRMAERVRLDFKKRGIALPVDNSDGSVTFGDYTIFKDDKHCYCIKDKSGEVLLRNINLPQTAVIIANEMALFKPISYYLLEDDKNYGYAMFEEMLYKKKSALSHNLDQYDLKTTKCMVSRHKKEAYKQNIIRHFEKLRKLA